MGRRIITILFALALGGTLSAGLVVAFSRTPAHHQLVAGQPISYWLKCLDDGDTAARESATKNLPRFGAAAVAPLIDRLDANDISVAAAAKATLATMGPSIIPDLARSMHGGSPARHTAAIDLITGFGPATAGQAGSDIATKLDDPSVGHAAAEFFIKFGPGPDAITAAVRILNGADAARRLDAIRVLAAAPDEPRVPDALAASLRTSDPAIRDAVWTAVNDLPVLTPKATDAVIDCLTGRWNTTSFQARAILVKSGPRALERLGARAHDGNADLRLVVVGVLREILLRYPKCPLDALQRFTTDSNSQVRTAALVALRALQDGRAEQQRLASLRQSLITNSGHSQYVASATSNAELRETDILDVGSSAAPNWPAAGATAASLHIADSPLAPPNPAKPVAAALPVESTALDAALARLDDPDEDVRQSAVRTVAFLAPPADPRLLDFAAATDPLDRLRRVRLLPFSADPKRIDAMIAAAHEDDLTIRRAAIGAMRLTLEREVGLSSKLPVPAWSRVVDRLMAAVEHDPSPQIRIDAMAALMPLRESERVRHVLTAAQFDPDATVAAAAHEALDNRAPAK